MYDPKTIAFEIRYPWRKRSFITIWHLDPEINGDDDSCDWFGIKKTKANGWYPVHMEQYDTLSDEAQRVIDFVWWQWRAKLSERRWWQHPRWHIHHWRFQIHPIQQFQRWAFSRCAKCGHRFPWGYSPIGYWNSSGPGWFRSEENVFHHECSNNRIKA